MPSHNGLWFSLLKMLISPTRSFYGASFFFFSFLIIRAERKQQRTLSHTLSGAVCTVVWRKLAQEKKKQTLQLRTLMERKTDLVYLTLLYGFIRLGCRETGTGLELDCRIWAKLYDRGSSSAERNLQLHLQVADLRHHQTRWKHLLLKGVRADKTPYSQ